MLNKYLLTCECGCGESIICYTGVNNLYLNFAIPQRNVFSKRRQKFKMTLAAMGSEKPIASLIVSESQLTDFNRYLSGLELQKQPKSKNVSKFRFKLNKTEKRHINKAFLDIHMSRPNYTINLIPTMGKAALIRGKLGGCFDIALDSKETKDLAKQIEKALNKTKIGPKQ